MTSGQLLIPTALYAVIAAGGVWSAASPSSTPMELARQIKQGKSKLVICSEDLKHVAVDAAKQCGLPLRNVLVLNSDQPWSLKSVEGGVDVKSDQRLPWRRVTDPQELKTSLIVLLYSSGTTGAPKGMIHQAC